MNAGSDVSGMAFDYLTHAGATAPGLENALGAGLLAGVGAILTYHVVAGNMFDTASRP
jgi:hypothetical protein